VRIRADSDGNIGYGVAFEGIQTDAEDYIHDVILSYLEQQQECPTSVLVVDDCANIRRAIKTELRSQRMGVLLAAMPLDAIRLLQDSDNRISVVIVDMFLGPADGITLLKYIECEYPHIRRILISGRSRADQLDLAVHTGRAHAVLTKPWGQGQIIKAISRLGNF
jgi:DNA-binding NtrC family response regulator